MSEVQDTATIHLQMKATTGYQQSSVFEGVTLQEWTDLNRLLHRNVDIAKLERAVKAMDQLFHAATNMYVHLVGDRLMPQADVISRGRVLDEAEAAMRDLGMIYDEDEDEE